MSAKGIILLVIFIFGAAAFVLSVQDLFKMYQAEQKYNTRMAEIDEQEREYCQDSPTYVEMNPEACARLLGK